jgi:hypothetical protein
MNGEEFKRVPAGMPAGMPVEMALTGSLSRNAAGAAKVCSIGATALRLSKGVEISPGTLHSMFRDLGINGREF